MSASEEPDIMDEEETDSVRNWESDFQAHYDSFDNLVVLMEDFSESLDEDNIINEDDYNLLYRFAKRIIIDLGTDYEHLSEMVVAFWIICQIEKQSLIIDKIDTFYTKISSLCNRLQIQYFENNDLNDLNELSLLEIHEFLQIERCRHLINQNLSKIYAVKLKLTESLKIIELTINLSNEYNKTVEIFNKKLDNLNTLNMNNDIGELIEDGFLHKLEYQNLSQSFSFESKINLKMNNFEKALESINKAIESNFTFYRVKYENNMDELPVIMDNKNNLELSEQDRLTKFIEKQCFEYYIERGLAHSNLGNHLKAFKDDLKATEIDPSSVEAWNNRAFSQYELGQYIQCINDCNFALETIECIDEFDKGLLIGNRGLAQYKLKKYNESINDLNKCILLCPQSRLARETLKKIWNEMVKSIYDSAKLLVNIPFGIAIVIANYGVGIDFNIQDSCNKHSNIVYHDINQF